jgi:hypothetical protein
MHLKNARVTYRVKFSGIIDADSHYYTSHLQFLFGKHASIGNYKFTGTTNDEAMYG